MTRAPASFTDLRARTLSAVVMIAIGAGAIWAGGLVFTGLVCVLMGLMVYELLRMLDPARAPAMALAASAVAAAVVPLLWLAMQSTSFGVATLGIFMLSGAIGLAVRGLAGREQAIASLYLLLILMAGLSLLMLREMFGLLWVLWLVALVIGSDVAGYFAGRLIGGPKLWPRVSPKKTWSGTVAGWLLAALIGAGFMGPLGAGAGLIVISVLVAMAGQAGDIAESAIKRHAGVKDSSNLIPGHGGVLDRFDAMIAAAAMVLVLGGLGFVV